jgi:hypothetical protein
MTAKSTKGVSICLTGDVAATPQKTITAITAGTGSTVEVEATGTFVKGDIVKFGDVGFASLNNKAFAVTKVNAATGFEIGNVILGAGTLAATPNIEHFDTTDITCLCLSEFSMSVANPAVIDVSTYCGSASIPSAKTEAGTASAAGFLDVSDAGYKAIMAACEDGKERIVRVTLGDNGYLIMPVTLSGLSFSLPLDGAQGYSFQFTFGQTPKLVF